jgi:hypothetical protein
MTHMPRRILLTAAIAATTVAAVAAPASAHHPGRTDAVATWNENMGKAAVAACISPVGPSPGEARLYAIAHVAIHDALNAIHRRSEPYAYHGRAPRRTSVDAAVAAAARDALVPILGQFVGLTGEQGQQCADTAVAGVEADYAAALGAIRDGRAKARGVAVGKAAAAAILARRADDGMQRLLVPDFHYDRGTAPGTYLPAGTPPLAFASGLGDVDTFALHDGSQFGPGPPHAVTDPRYTADYNQIKRLGGDGVTTPSARTADETEIAMFWYESSPLQWNRIARQVAAAARLGAWEQARLLGLLNMALTDGYIGTFATKYQYNYWRPVTAIRLGGSDGNPATVGDASWTPLMPTPDIPDYDSGHSVEGGTAAAVLRRFFRRDHVAFSACSTTLAGPGSRCDEGAPRFRNYRSFSQAAAENALSRILIGFHFREAVEVGTEHGRKIGNYTVDHVMRPTRR